MAQLVLGVAGAIIGSFTPLGPTLGYAIGSAIGGAAFPAEGPTQTGPRLTDLKVQDSSYGTRIPLAYGRVRLAGNLIWASDFTETAKTTTSGGKGGGGGPTTTTFTYDCSLAVLLCEGEVESVRRIWANKTLIYSIDPGADPGQLERNDKLAASIRVYPGSTTQLRDPTMVAKDGVDKTPAYRGTAYIVFEHLQLANYGNQIPSLEFEVIKKILVASAPNPTVRLNADVYNAPIAFTGATRTIGGHAFNDYKRNRVWASATVEVGPSVPAKIAYVNMITRVTGSLACGFTPTVGYFYSVVYIPDVDSLIVAIHTTGFSSKIYEISPDTGVVKSEVLWAGTDYPIDLFWDSYSKQVFGFTSVGGLLGVLRVAGIIVQGRDTLTDFGNAGIFGQFGWRQNTSGVDNISVAIPGYSTSPPLLVSLIGVTSDANWLYFQFATGPLMQFDPLANFKQFVPTAGGFIGPIF